MDKTRIEIVSSYLPCGMSWILNCFLELEICTYKGDSFDHIWNKTNHKYTLKEEFQYLIKHFPIVSKKKEYLFNDSLEVRWSHDWPSILHDKSKVIFFVRDPRDALFSFWKRINEGSFEEFLVEPFDPLPFSNLYQTELYFKSWKEFLKDKNHLIIRFEDTKANPFKEIKKALQFMELDVFSDELIFQSIEASDFKKASEIEKKSNIQDNRNIKEINRAGIAFEYRKTFSKRMLEKFGGHFEEIYSWLGYENTQSAIQEFEKNNADKISENLSAFVLTRISQIDSQPKLSKELKIILEDIIRTDALKENSWSVVNGSEILPEQIDLELNFIEWTRILLSLANTAKDDKKVLNELSFLAGSLLPFASSQKVKDFYLHRWFFLTGIDLNRYSLEQYNMIENAATERLLLIEELNKQLQAMQKKNQMLEEKLAK
jgi:hypothetical protein